MTTYDEILERARMWVKLGAHKSLTTASLALLKDYCRTYSESRSQADDLLVQYAMQALSESFPRNSRHIPADELLLVLDTVEELFSRGELSFTDVGRLRMRVGTAVLSIKTEAQVEFFARNRLDYPFFVRYFGLFFVPTGMTEDQVMHTVRAGQLEGLDTYADYNAYATRASENPHYPDYNIRPLTESEFNTLKTLRSITR